ncbi:MAG: hypothetical protein EA407_07800 [Rhodobacteraceae bacterium]|nr:MAG: hypothetical protein EA407_07800 [Paracoccaceae bacterium]
MDSLIHMHEFRRRPTNSVLTKFAMRVVSELTRSDRIEAGKPQSDVLDLLIRHSRCGEQTSLSKLYAEMKHRGISAEQVIDIYFPAAIDWIGAEWHESEFDILQTSIALSRLQVLLREMGRAWASDRAGQRVGHCVLLTLPAGEQHTLGAMIAANQMRRMGVSVKVAFVPGPLEMRRILKESRFSAVFVSLSNRSNLASCGDLIKTIRGDTGGDVPVVCGGGIVAEMGQVMSSSELADMVGANLATSNIPEALALMGNQVRHYAAE